MRCLEKGESMGKSNDIVMLRAALEHIAAGNISPAGGFARRVLEGATVAEAHAAETRRGAQAARHVASPARLEVAGDVLDYGSRAYALILDGARVEDDRGRWVLFHSPAALEAGQLVSLPAIVVGRWEGGLARVDAVPGGTDLGLHLSSCRGLRLGL